MSRWLVAGPSEYWLLAGSSASKVKTVKKIKKGTLLYNTTEPVKCVLRSVWAYCGLKFKIKIYGFMITYFIFSQVLVYELIYITVCHVTSAAIFYPEDLWQWKIPVTPTEIETTTFRLLAQCLKQLRSYHGVNRLLLYGINLYVSILNVLVQNLYCAARNQGYTRYMYFTEHFSIIEIWVHKPPQLISSFACPNLRESKCSK